MIADRVFKEYDIRGIADTELSDDFAFAVGNAFVRHHKCTEVLVGYDVRTSSARLVRALINGVRAAGVNVIDCGLVSTALIKWVVAEHGYPGAIMVTASHNPAPWNGFKFYVAGGRPFARADGLWELKPLLADPVRDGQGTVTHRSFLTSYIDSLSRHHLTDDREVFLDPSGGCSGQELRALLKHGTYRFVLYNDAEDGSFRVHPPNPSEEAATEDAREYCAMHRCIGAVFDADGDRIVLIDEQGQVVYPDVLGAWLATHLVHPGDTVVKTVRDSLAVDDAVASVNGTVYRVPVGSAHVQRTMAERGARLGIENSGHIFLRETHGAEAPVLLLLLTLKHLRGTLADAIRPYRERYVISPEVNVRVTDMDAVLAAVQDAFSALGTLSSEDGVRFQGEDWWMIARPSNTEPLLRMRWEAQDRERYAMIQETVERVVGPFRAPEEHQKPPKPF